jgi:hypothetical protein
VLGDAQVAIEVKFCNEIQPKHFRGLKAFSEEHPQAWLIAVSFDHSPRQINNIKIYPVANFLKKLWNGEIVSPTYE